MTSMERGFSRGKSSFSKGFLAVFFLLLANPAFSIMTAPILPSIQIHSVVPFDRSHPDDLEYKVGFAIVEGKPFAFAATNKELKFENMKGRLYKALWSFKEQKDAFGRMIQLQDFLKSRVGESYDFLARNMQQVERLAETLKEKVELGIHHQVAIEKVNLADGELQEAYYFSSVRDLKYQIQLRMTEFASAMGTTQGFWDFKRGLASTWFSSELEWEQKEERKLFEVSQAIISKI